MDKNRQLVSILAIVFLLSVAVTVLGPLFLNILINEIHGGNSEFWGRLLPRREFLGPEAYAQKANRILREVVILGAVVLATFALVLWDNDAGRFSLSALSFPSLNARTLAVLGTGVLALFATRGTVPYLVPLLAGAITLLAREERSPFSHLNRLLDALLTRRVAMAMVLILAIGTFFIKFPLADFDQLVFFDDYPTIYTVTLKGWEMLKQGGIFGWDPAMMGGYYTISDVSHNEIFFMLPFLALGPKVAFHTMILFFYVLFPFLVYAYARIRFGEERPAIFALWIGVFTAFGFFDNMLYWGMVNSFIGLDLMLVNLILFAWMREKKPYASLGLIISLPLTLYAAGGFFVYSLLLIGIDFLWHFQWKLVPRLAFVMGAAFLISLTYAYWLLRYPDYFIQSDEIYAPTAYTLAEMIGQTLASLPETLSPSAWLLGRPVRYQGMFIVSLPILAALAWRLFGKREQGGIPLRGATGELLAMASIVMLASLPRSPSLDMFVSRIRFVIPVFLALLYAAWIGSEKRIHPAPLLVVLTILLAGLPSRLLEPISHVPTLSSYHPELIERIQSLDSDLILLESMGAYDLATEGPGVTQVQPTHVHMEPYFPFETGKRFLANNQEGYHHSVYRRNFVTSGAFRGRLLPDWPMDEVKGFLTQWGVKHLALWSPIAKSYFGSDPGFHLIWGDGEWAIYEYPEATPGDAILEQGQANVQVAGYFDQKVTLQDVERGDLIRLRMNYFPAWQAYLGEQPIDIQDHDGLLAFIAPKSGTYEVDLRYPRYLGLSVLALVTIAASGFLTWRFKGVL